MTSAMATPAASRAFEWAMRVFPAGAFRMVFSVSFMHPSPLVETTVVRGREATGLWAGVPLTTVGPPAISTPSMNETENTMHRTLMEPSLSPTRIRNRTRFRTPSRALFLPRPLSLSRSLDSIPGLRERIKIWRSCQRLPVAPARPFPQGATGLKTRENSALRK